MKLPLQHIFLLLFFLWISPTYGEEQSQKDSALEARADEAFNRFKHSLAYDHYDSALLAINELIEVRELQENTYEWLRSMIHKAEMFRSASALDNALKTILEAETKIDEIAPSTVKSVFYNRKAAILYESKMTQEALEAVYASQEIDKIKNLSWQKLSNLNIEGAIYRDLGKHELAQDALRRTIQWSLETKDTIEMCQAMYNISLSFYTTQDYDSCIYYAKGILPFSNRVENDALIDDVYRILSNAYEDQNIYDSAFRFLDSAHLYTLYRMQSVIDNRVDAVQVNNELENQKLQNSVLQAEKKQTNLQMILLGAGIVILLLILVIFFKQQLDYKKMNKKQQELNRELEKSLQFKNQLIGIVAHDIRNPMGSLTSLIQLFNSGLLNQQELADLMQKLEASAGQVNLLLENLLSWVVTQKETIKPVPTEINSAHLFNQVQEETLGQLKAKNISLEINTAKSPVKMDKDMALLVVRNLLTNAIKFSKSGSKIVLNHREDATHHYLEVIDQGMGMSPEQLEKIKAGVATSKEGTKKEKGTGLGLQLCQQLTESNGGRLEFESTLHQGTTVRVIIPKD